MRKRSAHHVRRAGIDNDAINYTAKYTTKLSSRLHGSGQTSPRTSFVPGPPLHGSVQSLFTRFRANLRPVEQLWIPGLNRKKLHGSGVHTSPYEIWNRAGQKVDLIFSGPKLAHLGPVYMGPDKFLHEQKLPPCVYRGPAELDEFLNGCEMVDSQRSAPRWL